MKLIHPAHWPGKAGRARRLAAACIAYFTAVCASMAAAAAVVTETAPVLVVVGP